MKKCFEDFEVGFIYEFETSRLSVKEITDFAALYDPQRFHVDEVEAAKTHFGGLVASGFQTQLLCFVPFCKDVLLNSWSIGSPGMENMRWKRPLYPGEAMQGQIKLVSARPSSKRRDRGYLEFSLEARVNGDLTYTQEWVSIVLTCEGANEVSDS
jgi:acyl dehydratase